MQLVYIREIHIWFTFKYLSMLSVLILYKVRGMSMQKRVIYIHDNKKLIYFRFIRAWSGIRVVNAFVVLLFYLSFNISK